MKVKFDQEDAIYLMAAAEAVLVDEGLITQEQFEDWDDEETNETSDRKRRMADNLAQRFQALLGELSVGEGTLAEPCLPGWKPTR